MLWSSAQTEALSALLKKHISYSSFVSSSFALNLIGEDSGQSSRGDRGSEFRSLWHEQVCVCTAPSQLLIPDVICKSVHWLLLFGSIENLIKSTFQGSRTRLLLQLIIRQKTTTNCCCGLLRTQLKGALEKLISMRIRTVPIWPLLDWAHDCLTSRG